jgi:hypothetical protein
MASAARTDGHARVIPRDAYSGMRALGGGHPAMLAGNSFGWSGRWQHGARSCDTEGRQLAQGKVSRGKKGKAPFRLERHLSCWSP